ncbi:MAG: hypothetical protein HKO62_00970 [Gammaproteobacteria bacterium]|nr:hypothetical protein [Gammaproteobacteria bacterium]NNL99288.1 hypothetical protein [Gammaproteobacteria bacterium]
MLRRYVESGAYTDCYMTELHGTVTHADFVAAFYTTWVFKLERLVLRFIVARPSTDAQAGQLARAETDTFAAWEVEARAEGQLLLTDILGRTRSWLMTAPTATGDGTRLYFGSAVVAVPSARRGIPARALAFRLLLAFHKRYSVILLAAARRRLRARQG